MGPDTRIELVGARDQSNQIAVSNSNAALALNTIVGYLKVIDRDTRPTFHYKKLRTDGVGANIIYNPNDNSVVAGLPLKGHETMPDRATSRRVQNISKQAEWSSPNPSLRCRKLRTIDSMNPASHRLSPREKRDILRNYPTKIDEYMKELDNKKDIDHRSLISEYCATRLQPFIRGVATALAEAGYNFSMEEIYKGPTKIKVASLQAKPLVPQRTEAVVQKARQIARTLQAQQTAPSHQILPRIDRHEVGKSHSEI